MKRIIGTIVSLFSVFSAMAQYPAMYTVPDFSYGQVYMWTSTDLPMHIPLKAAFTTNNASNTSLQLFEYLDFLILSCPGRHFNLFKGGSGTDTSSLSGWINTKLDKSDSIHANRITANQVAMAGKLQNTRQVAGHALGANITVSKSDVGLASVDNRSDASKQISMAHQTATITVRAGGVDAVDASKIKSGKMYCSQIPIILTQSPDYYIQKLGSFTIAWARQNSGYPFVSNTDSRIVFQACIDKLTSPDIAGSGGGWISVSGGGYDFFDSLQIKGWEPLVQNYSGIKITGAGYSTKLNFKCSGSKNGLVVLNRVNLILEDLYISASSTTGIGLFFSGAGTVSERSVNKAYINNVWINSGGTGPAFYAQNFFNISAPHFVCESSTTWAIIFENTSTTLNYGNSNFGFLQANGGGTGGGLKIIGDNIPHPMNDIHVDAFYCGSGKYGIWEQNALSNSFGYVDLEANDTAIAFNGISSKEVINTNIKSGYLFPKTGGMGVFASNYSSGNSVDVYLNADATAIPIRDLQSGKAGNEYNFVFSFNANAGNNLITTPSNTLVRIRNRVDGTTTDSYLDLKAPLNAPALVNPTVSDQIATDSSSKAVNSKLVHQAISAERSVNTVLTNKGIDGGNNIITNVPESAVTNLSTDLATAGTNYAQRVYAAYGGVIKAEPVNGGIMNVSTTFTMVSQQIQFITVYLPVATTITGFKWWQQVQGNYTANNYNGGAIYSYSGGTLKYIDESANDGTIWAIGAGVLGSRAFKSTHALTAGPYVIALMYSQSAVVTDPGIGAFPRILSSFISNADFTNRTKMTSILTGQTALPTPTEAMSTLTFTDNQPYVGLY